jgi:hypothetical protein
VRSDGFSILCIRGEGNIVICLRFIFLAFVTFSECLPGTCYCQENAAENRKPVFLTYLYLKLSSQLELKSFDIGEVGVGEEVPVLIRILNRSKSTFELKLGSSTTANARLLNGPVQILDGDNGLVELIVKIPDVPRGLKDSRVVGGLLADGLQLQWQFSFRYRDMAVFSKNVYHFTFDVPESEPNSRKLTAQIPVEVSDKNILERCTVDADVSLQGMMFSIVEKDGSAFVEAKVPAELIAKTRISGKVRLKVDGKVASETTLVIKKRTDIELLPNHVNLKYDPEKKEFRGELIAKLVPATVPIEHVQIEAEYGDETPIELSIGKMSKSTGRVYLRVKGDESLKSQDLILFRISTPIKTEEQVLPVTVVR